jgi:hypothetical protein
MWPCSNTYRRQFNVSDFEAQAGETAWDTALNRYGKNCCFCGYIMRVLSVFDASLNPHLNVANCRRDCCFACCGQEKAQQTVTIS